MGQSFFLRTHVFKDSDEGLSFKALTWGSNLVGDPMVCEVGGRTVWPGGGRPPIMGGIMLG